MESDRCPLCGAKYNSENDGCSWRLAERGHLLKCAYFDRKCVVDCSINYDYHNRSDDEVFKRYNIIVSHLLKAPYAYDRKYWRYFYEESTIGEPISDPVNVNIANNMMDYPHDFQDMIDSVLLALSSKYSIIGYQIPVVGYERALYYVTNNDPTENAQEIRGILDRLSELGYLCIKENNHYEITAKGWLHIGELSKSKNEINQGFIAMAFKSETEEIGAAFHNAIAECGYIPRRIDQKEHNNQIVPEIFYEIKRSKFLVVDVTVPNYGAYYEAGYGEALNKQVIVCCRQDIFNCGEKPHFDIAQKSTVVWSDIDDLKQKLKVRIESTVGLNSNIK